MAGYLRRRLIEKGLDPRVFSLVAFGGAGPLHANRLMREVRLEQAIIPYFPGIASAIGCTLGQLRHDFVQTLNMRLSLFDSSIVSASFDEQKRDGFALMASEGVDPGDVTITYGADMCYRGQTHVMTVEFQREDYWNSNKMRAAFEKTYHERYSQLLPNVDVIIINCRLQVAKSTMAAPLRFPQKFRCEMPGPEIRKVYFGDVWRDCEVYDRMSLPVNAVVDGPAILEQADTTISSNRSTGRLSIPPAISLFGVQYEEHKPGQQPRSDIACRYSGGT